jgi:hypothetical protein
MKTKKIITKAPAFAGASARPRKRDLRSASTGERMKTRKRDESF